MIEKIMPRVVNDLSSSDVAVPEEMKNCFFDSLVKNRRMSLFLLWASRPYPRVMPRHELYAEAEI